MPRSKNKITFLSLLMLMSFAANLEAQPEASWSPQIPKTWDEQALASLEVPLVDSSFSPKHISASYYYGMPVRPIYKSYPIYAPEKEPAGYIEWLKQQLPEVAFEVARLKTKEEWIKAGELVFDAPIVYGSLFIPASDSLYVRDPAWYRFTGTPVAKEGVMPFYRYVIREQGKIEIGVLSCGMCHTRVMPDGSIIKGAQGNFPFDRAMAYDYRTGIDDVSMARAAERTLYAAPWQKPELALKTRRGTGYYKVPSLRHVWVRGPLQHSGSVATLEDWFDPDRVYDNYVPTGFRGYGVKSLAVEGHPFGLELAEEDRKALIAFIKAL